MAQQPTSCGTRGLHHVTAISGPAQENLDFYAGVLGMKLVKKSVNQDDPGTYHLFYADAEGRPGTDLTFFPWAHLAPSRRGPRSRHRGRPRRRPGQPRLLERTPRALRRAGRRPREPLRRSRSAVRRPARPARSRWSRARAPRRVRSPPGRRARCRSSARSAASTARGSGCAISRRPRRCSRRRWASPASARRAAGCAGASPDAGGEPAPSGTRLDLAQRPEAPRGDVGHGRHPPPRLPGRRRRARARAARRDRRGRAAPDAGHRPLLVQVGLLQGARRRALRAGDRRPGLRRRRSARGSSARASCCRPGSSRSAPRSRRRCRCSPPPQAAGAGR